MRSNLCFSSWRSSACTWHTSGKRGLTDFFRSSPFQLGTSLSLRKFFPFSENLVRSHICPFILALILGTTENISLAFPYDSFIYSKMGLLALLSLLFTKLHIRSFFICLSRDVAYHSTTAPSISPCSSRSPKARTKQDTDQSEEGKSLPSQLGSPLELLVRL